MARKCNSLIPEQRPRDTSPLELIYHIQMRMEFGKWVEPIMRWSAGKPVHPTGRSRRKTAIPAYLVDGLKAVCRMFAVNDNFNWRDHAGMFNVDGWRQTSRAELKRLGSRRCDGQFTDWEIRRILEVLTHSGILSRQMDFNTATEKSVMFIKLNGDRLFQVVELVKAARVDGVALPPIMKGHFNKKIVQKRRVLPLEAEHQQLHYNTLPHTSSPTGSVVTCPNSLDNGNSGQAGVTFSVSKKSNPMLDGSPDVQAMAKMIAEQYGVVDGLTHKQMSVIRRLNRTGQLAIKLTPLRLREFFEYNNCGAPFFEARTVDFLLHNWPRAFREMMCIKLKCHEVTEAWREVVVSFDKQVDYATACIETVTGSYLPHGSCLLPTLVAYSILNDPVRLAHFVDMRKWEIIPAMLDNPDYALRAKKLVPNIDELLGLKKFHWTGIRRNQIAQIEQWEVKKAQARAWVR